MNLGQFFARHPHLRRLSKNQLYNILRAICGRKKAENLLTELKKAEAIWKTSTGETCAPFL